MMGSSDVPLAGGQPISAAAADGAAEWLTTFMAGAVGETDRARWRQWRAEHSDNDRAWLHLEAVCARLQGLHGNGAYRALSAPDGGPTSHAGRRRALALLAGVGVAGLAGWHLHRSTVLQSLVADLRTGVGEPRTWTLDDGTRLVLNTASAVDARFDSNQRLLVLVAGEISVVTGHADGDRRPFTVQTAQGRVRALGTVFTVRQRDGRTEVAVQHSAVALAPSQSRAAPLVLGAGQRTWFSSGQVAPPVAAGSDDIAWTLGSLVADDMRLADFLAELGRYRRGVLRCDPAVADLRFSAIFPLQDTDRILAMLPNSLPVRVRLHTRYWVSVEADPAHAPKK